MNETDPKGAPLQSVSLHLLRPDESESPPAQARLSRLARLLRLDTSSEVLLTKKIRLELGVLAWILVVVFVFELLAWSFLFNGLFSGDMMKLHPVGTAAAMALGFLFAGTILFVERQILVTDIYDLRPWLRVTAALVRLAFILVAGFVVAHAVDLVVFRLPVTEALYERAVNDEALRLEEDLEPLGIDTGERPRERGERNLGEAKRELSVERAQQREAVAAREDAEEKVRSLQREVDRAARELQQAEVARDSIEPGAKTANADQRLNRAQERLSQLQRDLGAERGRQSSAAAKLQHSNTHINELQAEIAGIEQEFPLLDEEWEKRQWLRSVLDQRRRAWIQELRRRRPGQHVEQGWSFQAYGIPTESERLVPPAWRMPLSFVPPEHSFFDRLVALYEVVLTRSDGSRWKSPYFTTWVGVHLATIFIPLLVLLIKWLLVPREINIYYSKLHQAFAGDPDARQVVRVEEMVEVSGLQDERELS